MTTLRAVLVALNGPVTAGGRASLGRERSRALLEGAIRLDERLVWVCVTLMVLAFAGSFWAVMAHLDDARAVRLAMTGLGGSTLVIVWAMVRLWREASSMRILLALVDEMAPDEFKEFVQTMLQRLQGGGRGAWDVPTTSQQEATAASRSRETPSGKLED